MNRDDLADLYPRVRSFTRLLCEPLAVEDYVVQTMQDVSPIKWHLAHTSWFFETFILRPALAGYRPFDERYLHLFNSYYESVGDPYPRPDRGLLSRPTVGEIYEYRRHVDLGMESFLARSTTGLSEEHAFAVELGLNHEEQHQELIVTDVKHILGHNPLSPLYRESRPGRNRNSTEKRLRWKPFEGGLVKVGAGGDGFVFDNERSRHTVHLEPFQLADRLVTCGEYLLFMQDRGYDRPELWLSDGWEARSRDGWRAPLYWKGERNEWSLFTLSGLRHIDRQEPVCHVSYYEADAYARWAGARLPREEEWEVAAAGAPADGNFAESGLLHPAAAQAPLGENGPDQLFGDVWEWTASPYIAYPGYRPFPGSLGEYNGKFMCNQMVLRGGSCATPRRHIRTTYRNFFPPSARWQFSGIRLARF